MTIETKFDINDRVWFIAEGKAKHTTVIGINVICRAKRTEILYTYDGLAAANENRVFGSKQELLDSL